MARPYADVLAELEQLFQQRQHVEGEIVRRLKVAPQQARGGGAKSGAAAAKRQSTAPQDAPDAKRARASDDIERRQQELWKACATIVKRFVGKGQRGLWFAKPVTTDVAPNYFEIIKTPMDLGTIGQRLRDRSYKEPRDFAADMRLIWSNCRTYNPVGTPVRVAGDQFSDEFEQAWAAQGIEAAWDDLVLQKDPQGIPMDRKLPMAAQQLVQRVNSVTGYTFDPSRDMVYLERRKLSLAVSELQGEQLEMVIRLVAEHQAQAGQPDPDSEEEIEVDFETMESALMWKIYELVDSLRKSKPSKPGAGPSKSAGPSSGPAAGAEAEGAFPAGPAHSHSESDRESEQDVKGSNMVEAAHPNPGFIKNQRTVLPVDESMTGPKDTSALQTANKSAKDVSMDADKWNNLEDAAGPEAGLGLDGGAGLGMGLGDDDLWDNFKTLAEKEAAQKAEEERRKKELEERREREQLEAVAEARRQKEEEERKMREAEEAAAEEARRSREEARQRELDELQKQANSAQVYIPPAADNFASLGAEAGAGGLDAVGLAYKQEDEDAGGFDD